ncbi:MAG: hypothetical protein EAZ81_03790 [Verrucomicrobia bacterium]|nr:MAG: hypothetical protein EAZ81_03790 [Verrucomicrobiota bacterium]
MRNQKNMKKNVKLLAALAATAWVTQANAVVLLTDNFNTTVVADDQTGTLAPVTYTTSDLAARSGGALILNYQGNGGWGASASLNYNFATSANDLNSPLTIEFDMWADSAPLGIAWVGYGLGASQGGLFYEYSIGDLIRQSDGLRSIKLVISDTAGTGSGFNGITNGALVETFINGTSQGAVAKTLTANDGYLTFRGNPAGWAGGWGLGYVDNLSVSVVPEPSAALLGCMSMLAFLRRKR